MKFRHRKVKREHGIIQDALEWLEELSRLTEVTDIIPGVIEVSRSPERGIVYKYETQTGCKLLLKSNGSVQEAFVVTKQPSTVRQWIEARFGPGETAKVSSPPAAVSDDDGRQRSTDGNSAKASIGRLDHGSVKQNRGPGGKQSGKSHSAQPGPGALGRKNRSAVPKSRRPAGDGDAWAQWAELLAGDTEAPNLGERLGKDMRRQLRELQKSLSDRPVNKNRVDPKGGKRK